MAQCRPDDLLYAGKERTGIGRIWESGETSALCHPYPARKDLSLLSVGETLFGSGFLSSGQNAAGRQRCPS